jgi:hypothetical protein
MTHSTDIDQVTIDMSLRQSARQTDGFAQARERQQVAEADHQRSRNRALNSELDDMCDMIIGLKRQLATANQTIATLRSQLAQQSAVG